MTTKYNANLFESLKEALNNKTNYDSNFKDFLKFDTDKTYLVRLIPNVESIENTWFEYAQHIWKSTFHGKTVSTLCPNTYGQKCPICEYRSKIWASKNEELKEQIKPLKKNERWLYNVYVVSDPSNPSNEGQIKFLNAGSQLEKIIESARTGDDSEEFGHKIFDASKNGCNLRIKVEKNEGGYPTYVSSKFLSPSEIKGLDNDDAINSVYTSFKSVDTIFKRKTYGEIKDLLDVHFLGKDKSTATETQDEEFSLETETVSDITKDIVSVSGGESDQEKRMKQILEDL
jgi:hypothetical protein